MFLARPIRPFFQPRYVVYTCLFGYAERFNDFAYERDDRLTYVCFTDDPELRSDFWQIRLMSRELLDAARAAKRIKALAHRFLPEFDGSLYIDNTVRLKVPPATLFDRYLAPSHAPFVCFRHPWRDCVYDEGDAVVEHQLDDPDRVRKQMAFYRHIGYPAHAGLAKATLMLRRHNDPALVPVMERWHQQVLRHSLRDQLSLNPSAWFDGFQIRYLDLDFLDYELLEWPIIKDNVRVPRDFDDVRYHELNPGLEMNGRKHYLLHGAAEGRAYK
jgi:TOD1/MUCI70, glycosyltransferase-like domain